MGRFLAADGRYTSDESLPSMGMVSGSGDLLAVVETPLRDEGR